MVVIVKEVIRQQNPGNSIAAAKNNGTIFFKKTSFSILIHTM
jgi:hypothetical protein